MTKSAHTFIRCLWDAGLVFKCDSGRSYDRRSFCLAFAEEMLLVTRKRWCFQTSLYFPLTMILGKYFMYQGHPDMILGMWQLAFYLLCVGTGCPMTIKCSVEAKCSTVTRLCWKIWFLL